STSGASASVAGVATVWSGDWSAGSTGGGPGGRPTSPDGVKTKMVSEPSLVTSTSSLGSTSSELGSGGRPFTAVSSCGEPRPLLSEESTSTVSPATATTTLPSARAWAASTS